MYVEHNVITSFTRSYDTPCFSNNMGIPSVNITTIATSYKLQLIAHTKKEGENFYQKKMQHIPILEHTGVP